VGIGKEKKKKKKKKTKPYGNNQINIQNRNSLEKKQLTSESLEIVIKVARKQRWTKLNLSRNSIIEIPKGILDLPALAHLELFFFVSFFLLILTTWIFRREKTTRKKKVKEKGKKEIMK